MRSARERLTGVGLIIEEQAPLYSLTLVSQGEETMHRKSAQMIWFGGVFHRPYLGIKKFGFSCATIPPDPPCHLVILGKSPRSLHEDDHPYMGVINAFTECRCRHHPAVLPCLPGRSGYGLFRGIHRSNVVATADGGGELLSHFYGLAEDNPSIDGRESCFLCKYVEQNLLLELVGGNLDGFVCNVRTVGGRTDDINHGRIDTHYAKKLGDGDGRKRSRQEDQLDLETQEVGHEIEAVTEVLGGDQMVGLIYDDPVEDTGILQSVQLVEETGIGDLVGGAE
jgi:hypothetical protein